jgi:hypothetical protein
MRIPASAVTARDLPQGLRAEQGAQILQRRVLLQLPAHCVERAPRLPGRR